MRSDYFLVTKENFPTLFETFEKISHDNGAGAGHTNYSVPVEHVNDVSQIEKALGTLTFDELETFCIGDQREMETIAGRSSELLQAGEFLNKFFEDWEF